MNDNFDEASLDEQTINDVETARLALRWALGKIRVLHEEDLKTRQNLQEKSSQVSFLENQLKTRNSEIDRSARAHEEEMKSRQSSLEYQFHSRLERLTEREKELEDKISKSEENLRQKEVRLQDEYQKKSEELRGRWAQVEGELWQLRQEQLAKQQESERVYGARLEEEKKRLSEEAAVQRTNLEASYRNRAEELEKREHLAGEEFKKHEVVLKWAKDSWQKETDERERALKQKDLEIDKKILGKNQEVDDYKVKISLLEKQLNEFPELMKHRDEDLNRYKDAIGSLESVIRTLETEKKNQQADYEHRLAKAGDAVETERGRYREIESEIPKRLKLAIEHERNRIAEKMQEVERGYREDLGKRQDEIEYLQRNLRTFEDAIKTLQVERESYSQKVEQMQLQSSVKLEEFVFREKQLQSEYDVRLKVELEKQAAARRAEFEAAGRIYEDNLRLKVEEISHLRKDMDELSRERTSGKEQLAALRRELEAVNERAASEQSALRARFKSELDQRLADETVNAEKRHSIEKQMFVDKQEGRNSEFQAEVSRKDAEINALRLAVQKAGEELRMLKQRAGEELTEAVAKERARAAEELEEKSSRLAASLKLRDEKIAELSRAMDSLRVEQEELVLLERERLQRLYTEKEKAIDEEMAVRDTELLRARETLARTIAEKESLSLTEKRVLEEKITALTVHLAEVETAAAVKLDAALRRETERSGEIIERKNRELDSASQVRQAQDAAYRKTLEDFRANLADSLEKIEILKKTAETRQEQLIALQADLTQEKRQAQEQTGIISGRLSEKERLYRDLRAEYEDFKETFETEVKNGEKKYNDALLKLSDAEEQKVAREKQLEALKRDAELLRSENLIREQETAELKTAAARQLENERRELQASFERRVQESIQKEKTMLAEAASLRETINAKDLLLEKQKVQFEEARTRLKDMLEEEHSRQAESEASRRTALDYAKDAFEGERKKRAAAEAAAQEAETALREKIGEFAGQRSELEKVIRAVERFKVSFDEERKKREAAEEAADRAALEQRGKIEESLAQRFEIEALKRAAEEESRRRSEADLSASSLRSELKVKAEESAGRGSEIEALKHGIERLKLAVDEERVKREESELEAKNANALLREKQEEIIQNQKLMEQLRDKLRLWKNT